jgi:hypothetical protein
MSFSEWCYSNQWYGYLIPLQQAVGLLTQILISKVLGPCLLTAAHVLVLAITYVFFLFILPTISGDSYLMVRNEVDMN